MIIRLLCMGLLVLVSACRGGPPPKEFLLEPLQDPGYEFEAQVVSAIAMAKVVMPGYANDSRLASRRDRHQIVFDDRVKWADSPEDAVTRVLADRLRFHLEANVIIEPWPRGYEPEARVEVEFDKFLRDASGGAEVAGQIRLISGDGKKVLSVRTFEFLRYGAGSSPEAFFSAASACVNDVSRMIADSMRKAFNPQPS